MSASSDLELKRAGRNLKSILVEPFKQFKFGFYVIGISLTFLVVCSFVLLYAFKEQYKHIMSIFNVVEPSLQWELVLNDVFYVNAVRIGVLFTLYIVLLFAVVFRLTHRYYGPLISIERFVSDIREGNYSRRAKIREKDELQRLVGQLNEMAEALEKRHGAGKGCACGDKHGGCVDREVS